MDQKYPGIEYLACYLNLALFVTLVACESYVLLKIKFQLDRPAQLTLGIYTLSAFLQSITWVSFLIDGHLPESIVPSNLIISFLSNLSSTIIWLVLYYFVYELKLIQVKLRATSLYQMLHDVKSIQQVKYLALCIALAILSSFLILNTVWAVQDFDKHPEEHMTAQYADYLLRVFKIILDVWVCATFVEVYRYMLERKREQLREEFEEWTQFNKFIIVWTLVLVALNLMHSVGTIFYNQLFIHSSVMENSAGFQIFSLVFPLIFMPISDFLTIMTLLYLFYYQGMQLIKHKLEMTSPKGTRKKRVQQLLQEDKKEQVENDEKDEVDTQALRNILEGSYPGTAPMEKSSHIQTEEKITDRQEAIYAMSAQPNAYIVRGTTAGESMRSSSINNQEGGYLSHVEPNAFEEKKGGKQKNRFGSEFERMIHEKGRETNVSKPQQPQQFNPFYDNPLDKKPPSLRDSLSSGLSSAQSHNNKENFIQRFIAMQLSTASAAGGEKKQQRYIDM
ncbi:hypothetical protein FGO68_gene14182 [Halteria grandinella]|uniref:Uncharacterized protein n=1 Tax=Halteria grandinella TaxID=5974 RepID=A0A8J8NDN1_HALGN|nr:hypothetical protein FGO68_gene14182 [Halteria grandinella]